MKEFFVIDIGNSDTVVAFIKNYKIFKKHRVKTIKIKQTNSIKTLINLLFSFIKKEIHQKTRINSLISSVVPEINIKLTDICFSNLKKKPFFVSSNKLKFNIKINIKNKQEVGSDRISNTVAVKAFYKYPAIIVDFGTATTFDIIDKRGNYIGGLIAPGINLSIDNLFKQTSKLPLIKLKKINKVVGNSTVTAMQSGIYWGYVGLVSYLINKIKSQYKFKFNTIFTGGYAKLFSPNIKDINKIDENLTILGLIEIFKLNYE